MSLELSRQKFWLCAAVVLLLALVAREWFVLAAVFPNPVQGDVSAYLRYALHLIRDGTFSQAEPGQPLLPDAYRGPGYPFFLACMYWIVGAGAWFKTIYQAQVILGVATVFNVIVLVRLWLGRSPWALLAGIWIALEPHHIAATGTMLTELAFGLLLSVSAVFTVFALQRKSIRWTVVVGVSLALAYLVNPLVALFPPLLFVVFWRNAMLPHGIVVFVIPTLVVLGWGFRNEMQHVDSGRRAAENFVQGSWPEYHRAWKYQLVDPQAKATLQQINEEIDLVASDPMQGFGQVFGRMANEPRRYLAWYLLNKPFLLWDWDVRLGAGGVNVVDTLNSPLDRNTWLGAACSLQRLLNPLFFALTLLGAVLCWRNRLELPAGLLFLYVFLIHLVFQAEPRYSTAYKFIEVALAVLALAAIGRRIAERFTQPETRAESPLERN